MEGDDMRWRYFASLHWVKKDGRWLTVAEVYVTLRCSGPICG